MDNDIYEMYKNHQFHIKNGKVKVKHNLLYKSLPGLIVNTNKKIFYKDKNYLNIQRKNLFIYTKEIRKLQTRKSYIKNKKKYLLKNKQRYWDNVEFQRERARKYSKSPWNRKSAQKPEARYKRLFIRANLKKFKVNLTFGEYIKIIKNPCYYCNNSILSEIGGGLDRIDNSKGYIRNNVLPCCNSCNRTRGDRFTVEEMKIMINAVLNYRKSIK